MVADERSIGGVELQVQRVEILQLVTEYPITPKEHGIEFLMNRRHFGCVANDNGRLCGYENGIIFAIHNFFFNREDSFKLILLFLPPMLPKEYDII